MPQYGSIGEAVAKQWILRERLIEGFGTWQQVLASALSQTEPYILAADSIGELISNLYLIRPGYIPEAWTERITKLLEDAQFEAEKARKKAEMKADPTVKEGWVAEKRVDPEEAMKVIQAWSDLADERAENSET